MDQPAHSPITDYDSPWKEALEQYFPAFVEFFFPIIYGEIDWKRDYEFLDKELQQITPGTELGRRLVDKLVRVWRNDGEQAWVVVHIEVQGQLATEFARRMYTYHYRLFDRYPERVVNLAVLGDEHPGWRPEEYRYELWGCQASLRFPVIKLLDYWDRQDELMRHPNPFAVMVLAHLRAQATRRNVSDRFASKLQLVRALYERGHSRRDVVALFRFIDWLLVLPEELERSFWQVLLEVEEKKHMPYISSIERIALAEGMKKGIEQGLQQGIEQGLQQGIQQGVQQGLQQGMQQGLVRGAVEAGRRAVLEILVARFEHVPPFVIERLNQVDDTDRLMDLVRQAATVERLEDFALAA